MKQYMSMGIIILLSLLLFGCIHQPISPDVDLSYEAWPRELFTDSNQWLMGASRWFITGDPTIADPDHPPPASMAISTMVVRAPDNLTTIKVDGAFQVQIFGTDEHGSIYVYGPNAGVRYVAIDVQRNTLYVHQTQYTHPAIMNQVIIRIGIRHLRKLIQQGCGSIEAMRIRSNNFQIIASPTASGKVLVGGLLNVKRVVQAGSGPIIALGVSSPMLMVDSSGSGSVNLCGNVGIRSITHRGAGDINIIGANSPDLKIDADGAGKIGIVGRVNSTNIRACGKTRVYINSTISDYLYAAAFDSARIGLIGNVRELHINTVGSAWFGGRRLCAQNVYARARNQSHINITASNKAFASATDYASIYFFGPDNLLSRFASATGTVIAMDERNWCNANSEYRPYAYTLAHVGETVAGTPGVKQKHFVANYKDE